MEPKHHINPQQISMEDLEHLVSCDSCLEEFTGYVEEHELLTAPKHMKELILERSRELDIQIVAKSNLASKKLEFFYYTLKVGFASAVAIAFLVFSPGLTFSELSPSSGFSNGKEFSYRMHHDPMRHDRPSEVLYDKAGEFTNFFNQITSQLFKTEVSPDDEQEK